MKKVTSDHYLSSDVETDELPEGTEHVIVTHDEIKAHAPEDMDEDIKYVFYEAGDELPQELAEQCWNAFQDKLAAFDDEGERLDSNHRNQERRNEQVRSAIWNFQKELLEE